MKKQTKIMSICLLVLFSIAICASFAFAADYPDRVIKLIVPFSAGGGSDRMSRVLAPYLGEELGVDIAVENREGAGSQVGLTFLMNSKADGYTVSQANQPHTSFTITTQDAPYNIDDFAWVNLEHIDPVAVNVLNEKPWKDLKELFDYIKENPGEIAIGCTQASGPHVTLLYLQEKYGLDFIIVPYPGGGAGRTALVGGHIDVYAANAFANVSLKDQSRCLGIGWDTRSEIWPDAPTFQELFNDDELTNFVKPMASFRGFVFPKKFKEDYPDRWETFVKAYEKAYHSEGHMADSDKIGQTPIMHWIGPEESERMAKGTHLIVEKYSHYFK